MHFDDDTLGRLNDNVLYGTLGIRVLTAAGGRAESRLAPEAGVCWPFPAQPHGGVLFTTLDTTMAWALVSKLESGQNCTTIDLSIQYTAPARGGVFHCRAEVDHMTRRMGFVRGDIRDANGQVVALGQGTFRIINMDPFA